MQAGGEVPLEQVEGSDVDQLRLALEGGEGVGCKARRGVPLAGDPLANVTPASNGSAGSGSCHKRSVTRRL